ncbi:MAG: transposase [Labilithrix sp.]|nr:transposase [Labilithrix sp.]
MSWDTRKDRLVTLDMSDAYKGFAKRAFPNARLVADKFHVLRLLNPALTHSGGSR